MDSTAEVKVGRKGRFLIPRRASKPHRHSVGNTVPLHANSVEMPRQQLGSVSALIRSIRPYNVDTKKIHDLRATGWICCRAHRLRPCRARELSIRRFEAPFACSIASVRTFAFAVILFQETQTAYPLSMLSCNRAGLFVPLLGNNGNVGSQIPTNPICWVSEASISQSTYFLRHVFSPHRTIVQELP